MNTPSDDPRQTQVPLMQRALSSALLFASLLVYSVPADAQSAGKPGFSRLKQQKTKQITDTTEQSILANIENQKMIIDLEDASSPEYPEMIIALADFYWDLSETFFRRAEGEELAESLYQAEERKDADAIKELKSKKLSLRPGGTGEGTRKRGPLKPGRGAGGNARLRRRTAR